MTGIVGEEDQGVEEFRIEEKELMDVDIGVVIAGGRVYKGTT